MKLALIMLAAGNSRRFGSNKLLYPVEGEAMYLRALHTLLEVKRILTSSEQKKLLHGETEWSVSVTVVTQYREIGESAAKLGADVRYHPNPEYGISSSLQIGLRANPDADACLFSVSDQPWLKTETVLRLLECFQREGKGIACVSANGQPGNPSVFSKDYFKELLALTGDTGGKRVIRAHLEDVAFCEAEDFRELEDMDVLRCGNPL